MIIPKRSRYQTKSGRADGRVIIDAMLTKLKDTHNPKDNRLDLCDPISVDFTQMLSGVADSLSLDKLITRNNGIEHTEVIAISGSSRASLLVYSEAIEDCEFMKGYLTIRLGRLLRGNE